MGVSGWVSGGGGGEGGCDQEKNGFANSPVIVNYKCYFILVISSRRYFQFKKLANLICNFGKNKFKTISRIPQL